MRLILASASARRRELLAAAGLPFHQDAADTDERRMPGELPEAYVARVALAKAQTGHMRHAHDVTLGADTVVLVDTDVLGKPASDVEAAAMLARLSGRSHDVLTGVALVWTGEHRVIVERTRVWFARLSEADIDWYVRSGEPKDKAGAYAIQGLASRFVERIDGSYSNVVGLPVAALLQLMRQTALGIDGLDDAEA
jgi:septum formation protein